MSSAVVLLEQVRAAGVIVFYDRDDEIYTWTPKGFDRARRRQLTQLMHAKYWDVIALLKLATLETN